MSIGVGIEICLFILLIITELCITKFGVLGFLCFKVFKVWVGPGRMWRVAINYDYLRSYV